MNVSRNGATEGQYCGFMGENGSKKKVAFFCDLVKVALLLGN
jgi:hypothetical protein